MGRTLFIATVLIGLYGVLPAAGAVWGQEESAVPYALDGWEISDAPLVEQWLVIGPFSSEESVAELTSPEANSQLFPRAREVSEGSIWEELLGEGGGVPIPADRIGEGDLVLFTYVNTQYEGGGQINFSAPGIGRARILVNGEQVAELGAGDRSEALAVPIAVGWNKLMIVAGDIGPGARFYLQVTTEQGDPLPHYNRTALNSEQIKALGAGYQLSGKVWMRVRGDALRSLNGPFRDHLRELGLLLVEARALGPRGQRAQLRVDLFREISLLVVRGGALDEVKKSYRSLLERITALRGLAADDGERRRRIVARFESMEPWMVPEAPNANRWTLFLSVPHGETMEMYLRAGLTRRLLIDLLEEARAVVKEVKAGL